MKRKNSKRAPDAAAHPLPSREIDAGAHAARSGDTDIPLTANAPRAQPESKNESGSTPAPEKEIVIDAFELCDVPAPELYFKPCPLYDVPAPADIAAPLYQ